MHQAPQCQLANFQATDIHITHGIPSHGIWNPCKDGKFISWSESNSIREKRSTSIFNSIVWHNCIPLKVSFLLWRVLRGKIQTNGTLTGFVIDPVNYFLCKRSGLDTIQHTFNIGYFATHIRRSFAAMAGIKPHHTSLTHLLMQWWTTRHKNVVQRLLLQAAPILFCWNL